MLSMCAVAWCSVRIPRCVLHRRARARTLPECERTVLITSPRLLGPNQTRDRSSCQGPVGTDVADGWRWTAAPEWRTTQVHKKGQKLLELLDTLTLKALARSMEMRVLCVLLLIAVAAAVALASDAAADAATTARAAGASDLHMGFARFLREASAERLLKAADRARAKSKKHVTKTAKTTARPTHKPIVPSTKPTTSQPSAARDSAPSSSPPTYSPYLQPCQQNLLGDLKSQQK